jgi:large subunit ribosomal protein L14
MVKIQSILRVVDNSGARFALCIRVLGKAPKMVGKIGDIIVVSIKRSTPNKKIKKGTIQRAVIVRTASNLLRYDGSRLKFGKTCIVILNKMFLPMGTRVFGPVCKELRDKKFIKILSLATLSI